MVQEQLASDFRDILPGFDHGLNYFPVHGARALITRLGAAWPELQSVTPQNALRLIEAGRVPSRGISLTIQPALIHVPAEASGAWASSTISASWLGTKRGPGLGELLLGRPSTAAAVSRGAAVASAIVANRLSGLQAVALPAAAAAALTGGIVLVEGDAPTADMATLRGLLQRSEAAKLTVLVRDQGGRLARMARRAGIGQLKLADADLWAVIERAAELHAPPNGDLAVLAQLAGRAVFAQGLPLPAAAPALLAAAHIVLGSRYLDPADGKPIACEAFVDRMIEWRRLRHRVPSIACFVGISFWKRRRMAEFVGHPVQFTAKPSHAIAIAARAGGGIAVWPSRAPKGLGQAAAASGVPLYCVEDGFIRSRGLGADFIPPASVVIDRRGIYYDAQHPSDLEEILAGADFTPELLARAGRLTELLITRRITKYNLAGTQQAIAFPPGRRRILVPGQVADDLSVKTGGAGIAPGLAALAEIRARNPDGFVIYKPHPDVEAGHRPGAVPDAALLRHADLIVRDIDMATLIERVDEVHTVTSLAGFEALLRRRRVVTYGRPFYAGWGLTTDIYQPERRGRALSLEMLVAATLILYPHYIDPVTKLPCGPEQLIDRLDAIGPGRASLLVGLRRGQGVIRRNWGRRFGPGSVRRTAGVA